MKDQTQPWRFTSFYGESRAENKYHSWNFLRTLHGVQIKVVSVWPTSTRRCTLMNTSTFMQGQSGKCECFVDFCSFQSLGWRGLPFIAIRSGNWHLRPPGGSRYLRPPNNYLCRLPATCSATALRHRTLPPRATAASCKSHNNMHVGESHHYHPTPPDRHHRHHIPISPEWKTPPTTTQAAPQPVPTTRQEHRT